MPIIMVTITKTVQPVVPTALWKASSPRQTRVLQCSAVLSSEITLAQKLCDLRGAGQEWEAPRWPAKRSCPSVLCVVSFLRSFFSKSGHLVFLPFALESLAVSPPQQCVVRMACGVSFCSPCSPFYHASPHPSPLGNIPVTFSSLQVHPLPMGIKCNFPSCQPFLIIPTQLFFSPCLVLAFSFSYHIPNQVVNWNNTSAVFVYSNLQSSWSIVSIQKYLMNGRLHFEKTELLCWNEKAPRGTRQDVR